MLIELIRLDVLRLQALFPELILIWSEILPRCYWHFADNQVLLENTRKRTNTAVKGIFKSDIGKGFKIRVSERSKTSKMPFMLFK
jgi:hypothetical protein